MIAAMDVGGTNIRCNIIGEDEKVVSSESMSSQDIGLIEAIESIITKYAVKKIGISYAGQVDDGVILSAPNIKVDEPNIQAYFLREHGIDLYIDNDLKCAALAEYEYWDCDTTMVAASVGTGFGSAIVERGKLIKGSHNLAGEIGHVPYKYSEIPCGCGNHHCIEAFCSGSALIRKIEHHRLPVGEDLLQSLKEMQSDDAKTLLEDFHDALSFAVGSIISFINPEIIVLGGGVIHKNPYLLDVIDESVDKYALAVSREQTKIIISELEDAPIKGAALLVKYYA